MPMNGRRACPRALAGTAVMMGAPLTVRGVARSRRRCSYPSAQVVNVARGTRRYVAASPSVYSGTVNRSSSGQGWHHVTSSAVGQAPVCHPSETRSTIHAAACVGRLVAPQNRQAFA